MQKFFKNKQWPEWLLLSIILFLGSLIFWKVTSVFAQDNPSLGEKFTELFPKPKSSYIDFGEGEFGLREFLVYYARIFKNIVAVVSVLYIVIAGIRIVTAGGASDGIQKSRKAIIWLLVGLVIMQVAEAYVSVIYGEYGIYNVLRDYGTNVPTNIRQKLIEPIIRYFMTFMAGIAVFMVVLSGMRILSSGGDEGKAKKQQSVLFGALFGLILILVARPVVTGIFGYEEYNPQPTQVISVITQVANYIMGFTAIIGVVMLVYAGALMLLHFGNDAMVQKARKIIQWVVIGIALLISAYTIVVMFIVPTTG